MTHADAFKKYYQKNSKSVEGLNNAEVEKAIKGLAGKYLFFDNVTQEYNGDKI
jgi:hypothetical protein